MNLKTTVGALLGLGLLFGSFQANAGDNDFAPGDDYIGTLPAIYPKGADGVSSGPQGSAPTGEPCFMLIGTIPVVQAAISDAYGNGYVSIEETRDAGIFGFTFHGDVTVLVNRAEIEKGSISTRLHVGDNYLGGVGMTQWSGVQGASFTLSQYEMTLPYAQLLLSGAADAGKVEFDLANRGIANSCVGLDAYGGLAIIEQITH